MRNVSPKQTSGLITAVIHLLVYLVPQSEVANLRVLTSDSSLWIFTNLLVFTLMERIKLFLLAIQYFPQQTWPMTNVGLHTRSTMAMGYMKNLNSC